MNAVPTIRNLWNKAFLERVRYLILNEKDRYDLEGKMTTKVVHCKRDKYDVYIGRPSKWGNPFTIGKDGNRENVVLKYREWIVKQPRLMNSLHEIKDKTLACWCAPQACHGHVLAELANKLLEKK